MKGKWKERGKETSIRENRLSRTGVRRGSEVGKSLSAKRKVEITTEPEGKGTERRGRHHTVLYVHDVLHLDHVMFQEV